MTTFNATRAELAQIDVIAERAVALAHTHGIEYDKLSAMMDINAVHSNGCPLRLDELAAAEPAHFAHDVLGIRRHIDRETGKLGDFFRPRFARQAGV